MKMSLCARHRKLVQILMVICLLFTISINIDPIPKLEPEVNGDVLEFNLPDCKVILLQMWIAYSLVK